MPDYYEIRVKGHFDPPWSDWFSSLEISRMVGDETLLSGFLPDQAALHGVLKCIRDLNLHLISVNCTTPSQPQHKKGDFHEED